AGNAHGHGDAQGAAKYTAHRASDGRHVLRRRNIVGIVPLRGGAQEVDVILSHEILHSARCANCPHGVGENSGYGSHDYLRSKSSGIGLESHASPEIVRAMPSCPEQRWCGHSQNSVVGSAHATLQKSLSSATSHEHASWAQSLPRVMNTSVEAS